MKREVCRLATGHAKASPFPPELIRAGRDLVFQKLQGADSRETLDWVPERQPFYLEAISKLLTLEVCRGPRLEALHQSLLVFLCRRAAGSGCQAAQDSGTFLQED